MRNILLSGTASGLRRCILSSVAQFSLCEIDACGKFSGRRPGKANKEDLVSVAVKQEGRQCQVCKNWLPFHRFRLLNGKWRARTCKGCWNEIDREKAKAIDPSVRERKLERMRQSNYLRAFGISVEQRDAMIEWRKGLCDICDQPETRTRNGRLLPLCVDHDKVSGAIRGMLCSRCNVAIGMLDHDLGRRKRAYLYLRSSKEGGNHRSL